MSPSKRAIELNPNYEASYELYSYLLMAQGKLDDAIRMAQSGLEVAPLSTSLGYGLTYALYLARRYDEASRQAHKTQEIDPNDPGMFARLAAISEAKGIHDIAVQQCQKAIDVFGRDPALLVLMGHAYAASGRRPEALRILGELNELQNERYVSSYDVAILYVGLGDKERAFEQLNRAVEDRAGLIIFLNVEPVFDSIRSDPRFGELVRRMKLGS